MYRLNLDPFGPPFTKLHIIAYGSITLALGFVILLGVIPKLRQGQEALTAVATATPASLQQDYNKPLATVQNNQFAKAWKEDGFLIFDIRPAVEFEVIHITGSRNAPIEFLAASSFDTDTTTVIYSPNLQDLEKATQILTDKGVKQVVQLHGTIEELRAQGYALKASESITQWIYD